MKFLKGEELPEPLRIALAAELPPPTTKIASGEKLSLTVVDKRKQDFLGYWRGVGEGKIRASNSFGTVLREHFKNGLTNLGFQVLESPMISVPKLEITINNFEYWVAYYVNVDAQVDVLLYGTGGRVAKKSYIINHRFDKPRSYSREAAWIEEKINATISDLILKILADQELLAKLKD